MYNSMNVLPYIPYRIMEYLATNNENLWKLLKHNTYNALSQPNLTFDEKMELIWKNGDPQEPFNVFFTPLVEDAITESKTIMKLFHYYTRTESLYVASSIYEFDCLYGGKMSLVEYNGVPVSRGDMFIHEILKTLNGVDVGGVGYIQFNTDMSRYSLARMDIGNSKTFTGVNLYMVVQVAGSGSEGSSCD